MQVGDTVEYQYGVGEYGTGTISALNSESEIATVVDDMDNSTWRGSYNHITLLD